MTDPDALPEPDRVPGAPHPRHAIDLFGQEAAEAAFLQAFVDGRLHHGWMLTGHRGIGKATLAWRIARFLVATPDQAPDGLFGAPPAPTSLALAADHPVTRRVHALSDPSVHVVRRGGAGTTEADQHKNLLEGKFSAVIRVDEVRKLTRFLHLSATEGGHRVVIVDAADEMNDAAANALLKMLEEPPARTTLILVTHQPSRLLPTIRSRCRALPLAPLGPEALGQALDQAGTTVPPEQAAALAELSGGSVGMALRVLSLDGLALYAEVIGLLGGLPRLDRGRMLALAESCAGREQDGRLDLLLTLVDTALARLARTGVLAPPDIALCADERDILRRLSPDAQAARTWAECAQSATARARHARAVNIDAVRLVTDLFLQIRDRLR